MSYISTPERLVMCISWYLFLLVTSILSLLSYLIDKSVEPSILPLG